MQNKKPKILIALSGFLPGIKFGGTVTSRITFIQQLQNFFDFSIITLNHDYRDSTPYTSISKGWNSYEGHRILYLSDREHNYSNLRKIISEEKPDLIYASGSITTYFQYNRPLLKAAHDCHIPILITPDGDMCNGALRIKLYKKIIAICLCRIFSVFKNCHFQTTIEEETSNLQRFLGIPADKITLLSNLPHIYKIRDHYIKEADKLRLVFSSRIHHQKNLLFVLKILKQVKSFVRFDIYGQIEEHSYWEECQRFIKDLPPNIRISYKGALLPTEAQYIYKNYDFSFLPTISENYGYAIEESLTCGCPVIISRGTTPWDDLDGKAGFALPLSKPELFIKQIEQLCLMTSEQYTDFVNGLGHYLSQKLNCEFLLNQYRVLLDKLIKNRDQK